MSLSRTAAKWYHLPGWMTPPGVWIEYACVAEPGSPMNKVVGYGERVTERGFVHMDKPGYDTVSVTGQVAGGCTVVYKPPEWAPLTANKPNLLAWLDRMNRRASMQATTWSRVSERAQAA